MTGKFCQSKALRPGGGRDGAPVTIRVGNVDWPGSQFASHREGCAKPPDMQKTFHARRNIARASSSAQITPARARFKGDATRRSQCSQVPARVQLQANIVYVPIPVPVAERGLDLDS